MPYLSITMTDTYTTIQDFIATHKADDIIYALRNPKYFALSEAQVLELHTWLFAAIDKAKQG